MIKMRNLTKNYENCVNELNDAKLIIRELKVELRERDLIEHISKNSNSNEFLFIIEKKVAIATSKKLFDLSIFINDKNLIIND
jgi:hypothetical protein